MVQAHNSQQAALQARSPALADCCYSNSVGQRHKTPAAARTVNFLAAPGFVVCQDMDTVEEPVAPAVAAVRRFSLVSLFIAKLVPIIWRGLG